MGLDTVEIVMCWEESFGISITSAEAERLRTPRQSIDLIARKLGIQNVPARACLTLRAFNKLRRAIRLATALPRSEIWPTANVRALTRGQSRKIWAALREECGIASLPRPAMFSRLTMAEWAEWAVAHAAREIKAANEPWARSEIRSAVRAAISEVADVKNFKDDDDYILDIGLD